MFRLRVAVLTFAFVLASFPFAQAEWAYAHYGYLGTGQWSSSVLTWYSYAASIYDGPTAAAVSDWSGWTDLTISEETTEGNEDIGTYSQSFGVYNVWARAVICTASGCGVTLNEQYLYVEVQYNSLTMSDLSSNQKQAVASHEFGHGFSLAHPGSESAPHIMYLDPVYIYDTYGIYYSTQHDIDAVNGRY